MGRDVQLIRPHPTTEMQMNLGVPVRSGRSQTFFPGALILWERKKMAWEGLIASRYWQTNYASYAENIGFE